MINIPEGCLRFVELQYNNELEPFHNPQEVKIQEKLLANLQPKNVLEIGCGLGRVSVGFYNQYTSWKHTNFYMLDGDKGDRQIAGIASGDGNYYNSLAMTKEYCIANNIPEKQVGTFDAGDKNIFDLMRGITFDCVYSFKSIGFHWPISFYLDRLFPFIRKGTILCFGMRDANNHSFKKFCNKQIMSISDELFEKRVQDCTLILVRN